MGFSHDVIRSSLFKLEPSFSTTFDTWNPAFMTLVKNKPSKKLTKRYTEFTLVPSGPGRLNKIVQGDERIRGGRRQNAIRGRAYCATLIYAWDLPGQDLRDLADEDDVVGLIKEYPTTALSEFCQMLARQFCTGDVTDADTFPTLNGDASFDPRGVEASEGMLAFAPPLSQTGTVFGVARNSIPNWHNQYGHITSFAADGNKVLQTVYNDSSDQMMESEGPVDLLLADPFTYENYADSVLPHIRLVNKDVSAVSPTPAKDLRRGLPFAAGAATMYRERNIDLTAFITPEAQNGVCYMIHSKAMEMMHQGGNSKMETDGNFALRGGDRLQDQEAWRYEFVLSRGIYTKNLRVHGAVTGGAVE